MVDRVVIMRFIFIRTGFPLGWKGPNHLQVHGHSVAGSVSPSPRPSSMSSVRSSSIHRHRQIRRHPVAGSSSPVSGSRSKSRERSSSAISSDSATHLGRLERRFRLRVQRKIQAIQIVPVSIGTSSASETPFDRCLGVPGKNRHRPAPAFIVIQAGDDRGGHLSVIAVGLGRYIQIKIVLIKIGNNRLISHVRCPSRERSKSSSRLGNNSGR